MQTLIVAVTGLAAGFFAGLSLWHYHEGRDWLDLSSHIRAHLDPIKVRGIVDDHFHQARRYAIFASITAVLHFLTYFGA